MRKWVEAGDPLQVVADTVVRAATASDPKLRYSAGKQSSQVRALRRFMPERLVDSVLRKFNGLPAQIQKDRCHIGEFVGPVGDA